MQQSLNTMNGEEYKKFRDILRELKRIKEDEKLEKLDDNILFDGAVRIYNSLLINRSMVSGRRERAVDQEVPMTEKQRKLLEDLDYHGNMNITKVEATRIIEERLAERKGSGKAGR